MTNLYRASSSPQRMPGACRVPTRARRRRGRSCLAASRGAPGGLEDRAIAIVLHLASWRHATPVATRGLQEWFSVVAHSGRRFDLPLWFSVSLSPAGRSTSGSGRDPADRVLHCEAPHAAGRE